MCKNQVFGGKCLTQFVIQSGFQIVLQLCANSYKNCAINDTSMKIHELLEDIISKYFRYRDIPDLSYFVLNQKLHF